jgi:hypothetical protein
MANFKGKRPGKTPRGAEFEPPLAVFGTFLAGNRKKSEKNAPFQPENRVFFTFFQKSRFWGQKK